MKTSQRVLLFFILPLLSPLIYPPDMLLGLLPVAGVAAVVFVLIGVLLWRGQSLALTFSILLQGFNVITRLMMFFSTAVERTGSGVITVQWVYLVTSLISIGLSVWLLLRLDRPDVRGTMVA